MKAIYYSFIVALALSSCIGDDIIEDRVDAEVKIISKVDTLGVGDNYTFVAAYTNNIGVAEALQVTWESSDTDVLEISADGMASGIAKGEAIITATVMDEGEEFSDFTSVIVDQETVENTNQIRSGTIATTSSYVLEGKFELTENPSGSLTLNLFEDWRASSSLPGLYVYLTNNPNSINGAFEIGEVKVFEGAHSFEFEGAELNQYSHVLYFCKPFRVKVGDGEIEE